jgi:hypothetical protein
MTVTTYELLEIHIKNECKIDVHVRGTKSTWFFTGLTPTNSIFLDSQRLRVTMTRILLPVALLFALIASTQSFSSVAYRSVKKARFVPPAVPFTSKGAQNPFALRMAAEETKEEVEAKESDGTFYDDDVEPVKKETLSDSMRARLLAEASTGLDSDSKQTNVLLYVMAAVAVLVLLGGKDILF